jgi:hypothetical protein
MIECGSASIVYHEIANVTTTLIMRKFIYAEHKYVKHTNFSHSNLFNWGE